MNQFYILLPMKVKEIKTGEPRRGLILRAFCVIFLYVLSALILRTIQWDAYYYPTFTEEDRGIYLYMEIYNYKMVRYVFPSMKK